VTEEQVEKEPSALSKEGLKVESRDETGQLKDLQRVVNSNR